MKFCVWLQSGKFLLLIRSSYPQTRRRAPHICIKKRIRLPNTCARHINKFFLSVVNHVFVRHWTYFSVGSIILLNLFLLSHPLVWCFFFCLSQFDNYYNLKFLILSLWIVSYWKIFT